jgi:hypothetical protein
MTVFDEVVSTFFATGVTREATVLAQFGEARFATSENFVHVCLVPGVPQHCISGGLKHSVQGNGQLDGSQVGAKVTARFGDGAHNELTDLSG